MQRVVVDTNVFLSFIVHRNDKQRDLESVAAMNRYEGVATFDCKLANKLEAIGLASYW